jgi:hypothetical protein
MDAIPGLPTKAELEAKAKAYIGTKASGALHTSSGGSSTAPSLPLKNLGANPYVQMGACEGDCDYDSDCKTGLKCWQRSSSSSLVPGCKKGGSGDISYYDYCYSKPQAHASTLKVVGAAATATEFYSQYGGTVKDYAAKVADAQSVAASINPASALTFLGITLPFKVPIDPKDLLSQFSQSDMFAQGAASALAKVCPKLKT